MLLLCVILALVTVGLVAPCVLDIVTTPQRFFELPSKRTWLVVTIAFWGFGAAAWLIAGRPEVQARLRWEGQLTRWMASLTNVADRPADAGRGAGLPAAPMRRSRQATAAQVRFVAPDDNPAFLLELEHRIRDWRDGS